MAESKKSTRLAQFLRSRRTALQLTQRDVQQRLEQRGYKYSEAAIAHWERSTKSVTAKGILKDPGFLQALAEVLETTPVAIMEAAGYLEGLEPITGLDTLNSDTRNLIAIFEKLPPERRKVMMDIAQGFAANEGIKQR